MIPSIQNKTNQGKAAGNVPSGKGSDGPAETGRIRFWIGGIFMKGYHTQSGYMGLVEGSYILFASEGEYMEYIEEFNVI